jgi:hypothetical protein
MGDILEITPDSERARSLLRMAETRLDAIKLFKPDKIKFSSKIVEEYYGAILELITAIMCLDGRKVSSDAKNNHMITIEYLKSYKEFWQAEISLIDEVRKKRAGITYYGRDVEPEYIDRKEKSLIDVINKLKSMVKKKLG